MVGAVLTFSVQAGPHREVTLGHCSAHGCQAVEVLPAVLQSLCPRLGLQHQGVVPVPGDK